jgi:hypothetical protein
MADTSRTPADEMRGVLAVHDSDGNAYARGCVGPLTVLGAVRLPG